MRLQTFLHNFHLNNLNQFLFASIICHYWRLIFAQNATEMHQGCAESRISWNLDGTLHPILFYEINSFGEFVIISTKFDEKKIRLKSWLFHQTCKMAKNCCHKVNLPENDDNKKNLLLNCYLKNLDAFFFLWKSEFLGVFLPIKKSRVKINAVFEISWMYVGFNLKGFIKFRWGVYNMHREE